MKTIKSVLSLVAAVFIGSSVWAVTKTISYTFASGAETVTLEETAAEETTWYAWSDDLALVSVTNEVGTGAGTEASKLTFVAKDASVSLNLVPNAKKGATSVHLTNALGDDYTVNARVDVVQCVHVDLKHCADEEDPQAWFEIDPAKYPALVPVGTTAKWGFEHAYSVDEGVAKIKVVDGKFRLYAPATGKDGTTRCIFIKNENDVLENDAKIYMFYVTVSTVELEKWLTFPEESQKDSKATLNIRAHYLNNVKEEIVPKVLFVGTGCGSHTLTKQTIVDSINTILAKADVDVYIYKPANRQSQTYGGPNLSYVGDNGFKKGHPIEADDLGGSSWDVSDSGAHSCLTEFYNLFYSIASDETKRYQYDYIVMEFDGTRIASAGSGDSYAYDRTRELYVAEWLNEYYEGRKDSPNGRVVWIVDADGNIVPQEGGTMSGTMIVDAGKYFRPFDAYYGGSGANRLDGNHFRALLGLLNPWTCLENKMFATGMTGTALDNKIADVCDSADYTLPNATQTPNPITWSLNVGETYAHQSYYNDSTELQKFLADHIVVTSYSADITDNVETQGLSFVSSPVIYGTYDTNTAGNVNIENWSDLTKTTTGMNATGTVEPDTDHNSISGHVDNVTKEFWTWIQIDLEDTDESFRGGAKWDPAEQKFFRDPNLNTNDLDHTDGQAAYTYFYNITNPDDGVDAEARTLWDWSFEKLPLAIVAEGVTRVYNGAGTNATVVSVKSGDEDVTGATITAIYSSDEGTTWSEPEAFAQEKFVNVTNLQVKLIAYKTDYYFTATSDVVTVEITPRTVYLQAGTTTNAYNAAELKNRDYTKLELEQAKAAGYEGADNAYDFVSGEGISSVTMTSDSKVTNVADCPKANKIDIVTLNNKTDAGNYNIVKLDGELVVTPLTITVTADDKSKTYGAADPAFTWTLGGDTVPADDTDTVNSKLNESSITRLDYPSASGKNKAGTYENVLSSNDIFKVNANYIVNFVPGKFTIEPGQLKLTLKDSTTVYDGEEHKIGVEINVTNDVDSAREIAVRFSTNNSDWTDWTDFDDFDSVLPKGTNVADSAKIYVQATNILKTSLLMATAPTPAFTANANGNYKWTSGSAVLKITKRPITLKSPTKSCDYDEVPLTFDGTEITDTTAGRTDKGYVKDEIFAYSNFASNSKPGTSKSATFNYADSTALKGNYDVTVKKGTLTVRAEPEPWSPCSPKAEPVKETAWIYEWKFTGKTTDGVRIAGTPAQTVGSCRPDTVKGLDDEAIRVPSTLKIQGYTAKCIPVCEDISTADFAGDGEVFWLTKPFKSAFDTSSGLSSLAGHVIAKSGNKYELAGRFSGADDDAGEFYDFVFAGIGSYSKSKLRVSSVSGNFAGFMMAPHYHKYDKDLGGCPEAQIWNCDQSDYAGAPETVAFGKWSMKYLSTASKKYLKDGTRPKAKNGAKWHN